MFRSLTFLCLVLGPALLLAQSPKVLVIGIDGCRSDVLTVATTPNIDGLIANGYYSPDALNDDITVSGPGWSAIICGVRSDKHGVTDNGFSGSDYSNYPDFLQRIKDYDETMYTASIVHWNPINDQIITNAADLKINVSTDQAVEDEAVNLLGNLDPDAIFLHFDDPDGAGHSSGFSAGNAGYITQIEEVDTHIGNIMSALTTRPDYNLEDWLIVLTTDHGGIGNSHGGSSIEERRAFFIVSGDNVPTSVTERTEEITPPADDCLEADTELTFDGDNDSVTIPESSSFNFGSAQDFTVECRVKTNVAADVAIVGDKDWDSGLLPGFVFSFRFPSGPEWKVNLGDGNNRADLNVDAIADGEWHTLSVSFDRDGEMRAYTDGVFVGAVDISNIGNIDTNNGLIFGVDIDGEYDYQGALSEVRIWNGILTPTQISDWACQRLDDTHSAYANLLGYWPLAESSGNTAFDASGNSHDGTIVGATPQTPQPQITYDYSTTPRLQDVVPTVLDHLCIPILTNWNLDGQSRIENCATLPVNWIRIAANWQQDKSVLIEWETSREQGNAGFEVELLVPSGGWRSISETIPPASLGSYNFVHYNPLPDRIGTYRIRQTDLDGTTTYSPIVTIPPSSQAEAVWKLSPNPANGLVVATTNKQLKKAETWRLFNANGQLILSGSTGTEGYFNLDVSGFKVGVYGLEIGDTWLQLIVR